MIVCIAMSALHPVLDESEAHGLPTPIVSDDNGQGRVELDDLDMLVVK